MGGYRTAVLTSVVVCAACGGKAVVGTDNAGGDPTTTGTTGGGMQTATGTDTAGQIDPGGPPGAGGVPAGAAGAIAEPTPCGSVSCNAGLVCCNVSCGVCVQPGEGCPAIACAVPVDASVDDPGPPGYAITSLKSNFGFAWRDSWFVRGCVTKAGFTCIVTAGCRNLGAADFEDRGDVTNETFPLGGTLGSTYTVTFKFNGIAEGKYYQGGSWAQAGVDQATPGGSEPAVNETEIAYDTFYIGGTAMPSNYGVMRMRVLDATKKEVGRYYMNAYPPSSGAESHRTFLLSYVHSIDVPGQGFIEYHSADSDCHAVDNCGPGAVSDTECNGARNIPNEPNAVLPAMYTDLNWMTQPHLVPLASLNSITGAKQPWHAQISHLTVTRVVAK